ncbi:hypothetical protein RB595_003525 [Gaeumannomyces hyphopodioides]
MRLDPFAVYRFVYGADHPDRLKMMRREARRKLRAVAAMEGGSDSNYRPRADRSGGPVTEVRPLYIEPERLDDGVGRVPSSSATTQAWNTLSRVNISNYPGSVAHSGHYMETGHSPSSPSDYPSIHSAHHNRSPPQNPSRWSGWPPHQFPYQEQPPLDRRPPHPGFSLEPTVQVRVVDLTAPRHGGQAFGYLLACTSAQLGGLHDLLAPPGSGRLLALRTGGLPAAADVPWPTTSVELDRIVARGIALTVEVALVEDSWSWAEEWPDHWA